MCRNLDLFQFFFIRDIPFTTERTREKAKRGEICKEEEEEEKPKIATKNRNRNENNGTTKTKIVTKEEVQM